MDHPTGLLAFAPVQERGAMFSGGRRLRVAGDELPPLPFTEQEPYDHPNTRRE